MLHVSTAMYLFPILYMKMSKLEAKIQSAEIFVRNSVYKQQVSLHSVTTNQTDGIKGDSGRC